MKFLSWRTKICSLQTKHPWRTVLLAIMGVILFWLLLFPSMTVHADFMDLFDWGGKSQNLKTSDFTSFTELMETVKKFDGTIDPKSQPDETKAILWFYNHWGQYLQPVPAWQVGLIGMGGSMVKQLYYLTAGLENVFEHLFNLFGLFGYLDGDSNSLVYKVFHGLQITGVAIFVCMLIGFAIISVFYKRPKYKDIALHFILVSGIVAFLPWGIQQFSTAIRNDINSSINAKSSLGSLAIQPFKDNTVDIMYLAIHDFDEKGSGEGKGFKLDKTGQLEDIAKTNRLTDSKDMRNSSNYINNVNFGASIGVGDTNLGKKLDETHKGLKGLFEHQADDSQTAVVAMKEHTIIKGANALEDVYPRYHISWLAIIAEYLVLIVLLVSMSLKLVKSIFQVFLSCIVAPIIGYTELETNRKTKEMLGEVVGGCAGAFFEVITLRITLEIMRDLPKLKVFDGLSSWEHAIAAIVIYLGLFFGALQGITIVERWLGVSTGHGDALQQLMGASMIGAAAGGAAIGAGKLGIGAGKMVGKGVKATPSIATKGAKAAAMGLGAVQGAGEQVRQQGFPEAAKSGITNAWNKAVGGLKGKTDKAGKKLQNSFDQGENKGQQALYNSAPSPEALLRGTNLDSTKSQLSPEQQAELRKKNTDLNYQSDENNAVPHGKNSASARVSSEQAEQGVDGPLGLDEIGTNQGDAVIEPIGSNDDISATGGLGSEINDSADIDETINSNEPTSGMGLSGQPSSDNQQLTNEMGISNQSSLGNDTMNVENTSGSNRLTSKVANSRSRSQSPSSYIDQPGVMDRTNHVQPTNRTQSQTGNRYINTRIAGNQYLSPQDSGISSLFVQQQNKNLGRKSQRSYLQHPRTGAGQNFSKARSQLQEGMQMINQHNDTYRKK